MNNNSEKLKVAIIGSGPCGLSILRSFQQAEEKGKKIRYVNIQIKGDLEDYQIKLKREK